MAKEGRSAGKGREISRAPYIPVPEAEALALGWADCIRDTEQRIRS